MSQQAPVQLASMDWPWKSENPGVHIILISDAQFTNLADHPDEAVEKMYPWADAPVSLRQYCRDAAERGATTLRLAYDYFFGGSERGMYPDTEAFQETLKKVHDVAAEFGIGLEPSVLSPLELGVGYNARTGEAGRWMHYREGLRDPETGEYEVSMWQQTQWCNNKGPIPVTLIGARAFAFREERIPGTPFFAVSPGEIVGLPAPAIEEMQGTLLETRGAFKAVRVRVHGEAASAPEGPKLDRVLVVLLYETLELDYFSPGAPQFLDELVRQYHERGIEMTGIYADETHIQQDWSYHAHMDNGQFTVRYASEGFERAFAARFGEEYADFAKYMVYFTCHQHDFYPTHEPKLPSQHVFGASVEDIYRTLLFRRNYYQFLEHGVVQLMVDARNKMEQLSGRTLDIYYHSTWAESPTCDAWAIGGVHASWSFLEHRRQYEYTPDFVWSNTVHQAAAACADQFAWNEYLTGGNDDTPEGGYADRNYYGRVLACSLAALNRRPLASAGMWGMPAPVFERMLAVSHVYGALGHPAFRSVEDYEPRQIEVLFLYPQDLVAVEERFGSWMVQYGYANLITADRLLQYGRVSDDGYLVVKGQGERGIESRYRAVCAQYEPFPSAELIALLQQFAHQGGTVIWSGTPPMLGSEGEASRDRWLTSLFGVEVEPTADPLGLAVPARQVRFEGALDALPPMAILTDFVVDRVFPVRGLAGIETLATLQPGGASPALRLATRKTYASGGQAVFLGFRPRDDQAASTGIEARTWFEILRALGAYPGSGSQDDNPAVISRTTGYLATRFANGTLALCPHYRDHEESWPGGFFRDEKEDAKIMAETPPPDDTIELRDFHLAGQTVTYHGRHAVAWRRAEDGGLLAFAGIACDGITVDGNRVTWADHPVNIAWHPLAPEHATPAHQPLYRVWCECGELPAGESAARMRVPLQLDGAAGIEVWLGAYDPGTTTKRRRENYGRAGYGLRPLPFTVADGSLILEVDEETSGHWFYVVRAKTVGG